jgi:glutathione synthase/RimK-type ligase-like ATP-grasp enzyme
MERTSITEDIKNLLLKFMEYLGLEYGAIDMKLTTRDRDYYFLEINLSGQYLFIEYETGLQISDSLASYLSYSNKC